MNKFSCMYLNDMKFRPSIRVFFQRGGLLLIPASLLLDLLPAAAQTWNGSQSTVWEAPENWDGGSVPQNGANTVTINTGNPASASGINFNGMTLRIAQGAGVEGSLELFDDSDFSFNNIYIGETAGAVGSLALTDSTISVGRLRVGISGHGKLTLSGEDTILEATGGASAFNIGDAAGGYGFVEVLRGAEIKTQNISLGNLRGSGELVVNGSGSSLTINGRDLSAAGATGNVSIEVSDGGLIDIKGDPTKSSKSYGLLQLGSNPPSGSSVFSQNTVLITGQNSRIVTTGEGRIAEFGYVDMHVEDHGLLDIGDDLYIGGHRSNRGRGTLTMTGNSTVRSQGDTLIGYNGGWGTVTLGENSTLSVGGELTLADNHTSQYNSRALLFIGAHGADAPAEAGILDVSKINFGSGDGWLIFNHTADEVNGAYEFDHLIAGAGNIENIAGLTQFSNPNNSSFTGTTFITGGTMRIDGVLGGSMDVDTNGHLQGIGTVGSIVNRGTISPGNSIGTLTIDGDYEGDGGLLNLEVALGGDTSLTDKIVVTGHTSGQTNVWVTNTGGSGGLTQEGIKVVQVDGDSEGIFDLLNDEYSHGSRKAVVAGAYAYSLYQNGIIDDTDGDWYLRSVLRDDISSPNPDPLYQAGTPVYETYPQLMLGINGLSTLQQRVGNRYWAGAGKQNTAPDVAGATIEQYGIWGRVEGAHNRLQPRVSTADAEYDYSTFKFQAGLDAILTENKNGVLIGGITVHYAYGSADIWSPYDTDNGGGKISTDGYGFGGTLTWYGENGFYLDGQTQATWYNSDLSFDGGSQSLVSGNDGFGYAFSLEAGKQIAINPAWSVTPQAQLVYSKVNFDEFVDTFETSIKLNSGDSLQGRLGLTVSHEDAWLNENGMLDRAHVYGIANLYYEFLEGTEVDVAGVSFVNGKERLWGGLGLGGSYTWDDDGYSIYGEGIVNTSLNNFGDSYSFKGNIGLRMKW